MTPQHIIIAVSALSGIIGGMGMGGGTLLIPLLTVSAGLEQHLAQSINLIAFVPLSLIALTLHIKNGYLDVKKGLTVSALALPGAIGGSFLARYAGGYILRAMFGAFLILLGLLQLVKTVRAEVKARGAAKKRLPAEQQTR